MSIISSQAIRAYYVLPEDGQVGCNVS